MWSWFVATSVIIALAFAASRPLRRHSFPTLRPMNMTVEPTYRTAFLAGLWSSLGLALFYFWLEHNETVSPLVRNVVWFVVLGLFIYLPGYYVVVGASASRFGRNWLSIASERQRYLAIVKRIALWLALAAGGFAVTSWLHSA